MLHHSRLLRAAHAAALITLRSVFTAIGSAPVELAIWWITHR